MASSKGFTLLEVLVAMIVLAIALLGLAKLQAFAMKNTGNTYYKTQATLMLNQAAEVLRLNQSEDCPETIPGWLSTQLPETARVLPGGVLTISDDETNPARCIIELRWTESANSDSDGALEKFMSVSVTR